MKVIYLSGLNPLDLERKINTLAEGQWRLVTVYKDKDMFVAWLQAVK